MSAILCLNSGSSSLKFAVFDMAAGSEVRLAEGAVENVGPDARLWIRQGDNQITEQQASLTDAHASVEAVFSAINKSELPRPVAAGHRIVHGGPHYTSPERISPEVLNALKTLVPLAPLHLPGQIELVEAIASRYANLPQVACFDTAFHAAMPEVARRFPIPRELWQQGIQRYGFHGLSYEYVLSTLGDEGKGRVIIAHLGNGASMAAIRDGQPIDTSMGLTPTGGFMMSTRSGDLDPGVLVFLTRAGYTADALEKLLNRQSGLLGVSGSSSDMKTLLEKRNTNPAAAQAVEMFCRGVRKFIGAFAAVLGGLDTMVFTGGIGEHAAPVRAEICQGLEFLGIEIDPARNQQHAPVISRAQGRCTVRVVQTNEDLMIARHTRRFISKI